MPGYHQPYIIWGQVLVSVFLSSAAQIVLKHGLNSRPDRMDLGVTALFNLTVMGGLALYCLGAVIWLAVLARLEVTRAYPFVGLGFILTMILGNLFLGEKVGPQRAMGTLLIAAGVVLVGRS